METPTPLRRARVRARAHTRFVTRPVLSVALLSVLTLGAACGSDANTSSGVGPQSSSATGATNAPTVATTIPLLTAPTAPPTTSANPNKITIQNFTYTGLDAAQANVTWSISDKDGVAHTVSADDKSFVWRVEPGQTTAFTKTLAPGSYPIHCDVHPDIMKGVLVVK